MVKKGRRKRKSRYHGFVDPRLPTGFHGNGWDDGSATDFSITPEEEEAIVLYGKELLNSFFGAPTPSPPSLPLFLKPYGAFASLYKGGELRGCVGRFPKKDQPFYEALKGSLYDSAFSDPRFPPLREEELKEIVLEISIIPYLERIPDLTSFTPGRDGLYLVGPSFRGTLLPQVAERVENDRERFVDLLLKKIGINRSDLLDPRVILYRYPVWIVREKSR